MNAANKCDSLSPMKMTPEQLRYFKLIERFVDKIGTNHRLTRYIAHELDRQKDALGHEQAKLVEERVFRKHLGARLYRKCSQ